MTEVLSGFTATRGVILLDFDGPVCDIFAGQPDYVAAHRLRRVLDDHGVVVPADVAAAHDPLRVLRYAGEYHRHLVPEVEYELQLAELDAVETAKPTPGAFDVIRDAPDLRLAIVSNNSERAIVRYFELHRPQDWTTLHPVFPIVGRDPTDPSLMKPHAHAVLAGIRATASSAGECVIVGDSATDVIAARAAGIRSIGYATESSKAEQLIAAGADAVIADMVELAEMLRAQRQ